MDEEQVRRYLADNGYPEYVVRGGMEGLLKSWGTLVREVEAGYRFTLFDYRNDLDCRAILAMAGCQSPELEALDARFRACLERTDVRVWESSADDPWWDFGIPRQACKDFQEDLRAEGLVS
jgi:hypothetical protein